jgi:Fur family ferric uptake transcriptional regulator
VIEARNNLPPEEPFTPVPCAVFRSYLKSRGLKFTSERASILDAVLSKTNVFEAEGLLYEMRQAGRRVSRPTIYRTLKFLLQSKILREILIDSKQAHYELSLGREPKGHLVCLKTNTIVEFNAPELIAIRNRICQEHGFDPVSHRFVIYGISAQARLAEK